MRRSTAAAEFLSYTSFQENLAERERKIEKLNLRPSKPASIGALIGISFLLLFRIAFSFLVGTVLVDNEASLAMSIMFYLFMIAWRATALFMLV